MALIPSLFLGQLVTSSTPSAAQLQAHSTVQTFPDRSEAYAQMLQENKRKRAEAALASQQAQVAPPPQTGLGGGWAALRQCESGGDYHNKNNPSYRGAYQFSFSTWQSVGGAGDPADASPAEQDMRAQMLQQRSGWSQWECAYKVGIL